MLTSVSLSEVQHNSWWVILFLNVVNQNTTTRWITHRFQYSIGYSIRKPMILNPQSVHDRQKFDFITSHLRTKKLESSIDWDYYFVSLCLLALSFMFDRSVAAIVLIGLFLVLHSLKIMHSVQTKLSICKIMCRCVGLVGSGRNLVKGGGIISCIPTDSNGYGREKKVHLQ